MLENLHVCMLMNERRLGQQTAPFFCVQAFDWAERSRKGLLLFIDEADAFLGRRR